MPFLIGILLFVGYIVYELWRTNATEAGAPYEGMNPEVVERVMRMAEVGKDDVFYDLGSGDGRLVIAAAMRGARATGVEIDKYRAAYSRIWIKILGLSSRAKILTQDAFGVNISNATVVNTYLLPKTHEKLKEKLKKELKPGTKIIAVAFSYKNWEPVKFDPRGTKYGPIYMYRI